MGPEGDSVVDPRLRVYGIDKTSCIGNPQVLGAMVEVNIVRIAESGRKERAARRLRAAINAAGLIDVVQVAALIEGDSASLGNRRYDDRSASGAMRELNDRSAAALWIVETPIAVAAAIDCNAHALKRIASEG